MKFGLTFDTSDLDKKLNTALSDAARQKSSLETAIRDVLLDKIIEDTPTLQIAETRTGVEARDFGWHKTSYTPKTPFTGRRLKGAKLYYYQNRYPDALWSEISAQRKAALQRQLNKVRRIRRVWRAVGRNEIVTYTRNLRQAEQILAKAIAEVEAALVRRSGVKIDIRF